MTRPYFTRKIVCQFSSYYNHWVSYMFLSWLYAICDSNKQLSEGRISLNYSCPLFRIHHIWKIYIFQYFKNGYHIKKNSQSHISAPATSVLLRKWIICEKIVMPQLLGLISKNKGNLLFWNFNFSTGSLATISVHFQKSTTIILRIGRWH